MSTELVLDVVCKDCGDAGKVVLDLVAFKASCQEQRITEQEGAEAFGAFIQKVDCPACEARRN